MSRQNCNLGSQVRNLHVKNKVVVAVTNTTKVGNGAARKPTANNNTNNFKPVEGNGRFYCQTPLGCVQNANANKNRNYNHGIRQNVPKNAFPQQQFNANCQNQYGNATKPQPYYTNIKTANQTNLQFGSNSKPISHGYPKRNTNNNRGTNGVPFKNHKQSNNSKVVVNVKQVVVHKHIVVNK